MSDYKTSEVLKQVLQERHMTQTELASRLGIKSQAVQQWCAGKTHPRGKNLRRLSEILSLSPAFLQFGPGAGREPPGEFSPSEECYSIPMLEARGSCGAGSVNRDFTTGLISMVKVNAMWLRTKSVGASPSHLQVITAQSDSMSPTIEPMDFCFVDRRYEQIREEGVYVLTYANGGGTVIKRVMKKPDGSVILVSDNTRYPAIELAPDEVSKLAVEGKCVLSCRAHEI